MPQLLHKKPTQNTKQNHMHIKKKVAEGHHQEMQDTPPTTRLSQDTEHKSKVLFPVVFDDETTLAKCCFQLCLMTKPP